MLLYSLLTVNATADLQNHPEPLLHLAIENSRSQILQFLIDAGADVDLADEIGVTPLCSATRKKDLTSMRTLLEASDSSNDGSLHEAAHLVSRDAIELLLEYGHDPNFGSVRFEGRPPMFELCYQAPIYLQHSQATAQQKDKEIKKAIQLLIKAGGLTSERLPQAGGRYAKLQRVLSSFDEFRGS